MRATAGSFHTPVPDDEMSAYLGLPAGQQPDWGDRWLVDKVKADIAAMPALVPWREVRQLRALLAEAAGGRLLVVQAGDCAEDLLSGTPEKVSRKVGLLHALAGVMQLNTGLPAIRVGRIAGQFAKPRSRPTERFGGVELPVFRGLIVNAPEPDSTARRPDPLRLPAGHNAARETMCALRRRADTWTPLTEPPVWTSHEALLLDYELPQLRRSEDGRTLLTSSQQTGHWYGCASTTAGGSTPWSSTGAGAGNFSTSHGLGHSRSTVRGRGRGHPRGACRSGAGGDR